MKRAGTLALLAVLAVGGLWLGLRWLRPGLAPAVYLEPDAPTAWAGISEEQRAGILALLPQALELDPGWTVVQERPSVQARRGCRILSVAARRDGNDLQLTLRDSKGGTLDQRGAPLATVDRALAALGFRTQDLPRLLPADPAAFWTLAELSGPFTFEQLKQRKEPALALAARNPDSAACQYLAAYTSLRLLIVEASSRPDALEDCDRMFQRALQILPGYPLALYHYCRFKADLGAGRESLELALQLRDRAPNQPLAYGALAYAARNAGLLEAAREALAARESLVGDLIADPGLGENTWLYLGDLDRFERSLALPGGAAQEGATAHPIRLFYLGYVRLLRGKREEALASFRASRAQPGRVVQFESLSGVYECALSGRPEEALDLLRRLQDTRSRLRVPDGEFTFKLAEAFAFLGAHGEAVETASSAFAQGFGCTRWYRQAPFLRPLQGIPRWQGLLHRLQEREDLLRDRFPPRRFGRG